MGEKKGYESYVKTEQSLLHKQFTAQGVGTEDTVTNLLADYQLSKQKGQRIYCNLIVLDFLMNAV